MASFVGCSPLLHTGFSLPKREHKQHGTIFSTPISSFTQRRRIFVCGSDAQKPVSAPGHMNIKDNPGGSTFSNRRAMLAFLAFSAFGWSESSGEAAIGVAGRKDKGMPETSKSQNSEVAGSVSPSQQENAKAEFADERKSEGSLLFLNEIGILGSGVVCALYLLERKEKVATELTIEAVTTELKEKEVAMASLREDLERKIHLEQDKSWRQAKKAEDEQAALSKQLMSAKAMETALQKQLEREENLVQELEGQVEKFNSEILQMHKDNMTLEAELENKQSEVCELEDKVKLGNIHVQEKEKDIDNLKVSLEEKEKSSSVIAFKAEQTRKLLSHTEDQVKKLQQELDNAKNNLHQRELSLKELNNKLALAIREKNEIKEKLALLHEEHNRMKLIFEKDLASARQAIFAKQEEVNQLKEKLNLDYEEDKRNKWIIAGLQKEKSTLEALVEEKRFNLEHLDGQLQKSVKSLEVSRSQVATLSSDLATLQEVKSKLESGIARLQNERDMVCNALQKTLREEEQTSTKLTSELASVKKALDTTRNEHFLLNKKLKDTTASHEKIKEELSQLYKTAESTLAGLNEEKKAVAALRSKIEASERALIEEKENKRMLHKDFEEATKSMEDMRSCIMSLSNELEIAKSKIDTLDTEKATLYESLEEQKQLFKGVQEGAEHANKILMSFGKEKDIYLKRAKKLEEELSSAKGEILRLRKQLLQTNNVSTEAQQKKKRETTVGNIRTNIVADEAQQQNKKEETKGKQYHDTERHLTDVSVQIESMQEELSHIQKVLSNGILREKIEI